MTVELPPGPFGTIVVDPPWRYDNAATRNAASPRYDGTLSVDELAGIRLPAGEPCHLYLWTTVGFLRPAFDLVDAWGFTYKTCLTWVKPQMGMGNYFRVSTEHVLFATRGKLRTARRDVLNYFTAPRTRHSAKPDAFYDMVEEMSPGPYLDVFARRRRMGWEVFGNEA